MSKGQKRDGKSLEKFCFCVCKGKNALKENFFLEKRFTESKEKNSFPPSEKLESPTKMSQLFIRRVD